MRFEEQVREALNAAERAVHPTLADREDIERILIAAIPHLLQPSERVMNVASGSRAVALFLAPDADAGARDVVRRAFAAQTDDLVAALRAAPKEER